LREYDSNTATPTRHRLALGAGAVLIAVAVGLGVWLVAGDGSSNNARPAADPVAFLRSVVAKIAANDYDHVWQTLHPSQQRVATKQQYVQCEQLSPIPGRLDSIELVRSQPERIAVAGGEAQGEVDSEAATFRVTITEPTLNDRVVVPMTVHAVAVDGRWRWILSPKRFDLYRTKSCF
jgi:uncharacterized protein YchJ